ncbi:TrkA family potassium uptake protein [Thioclava sp. FTW29]|uniref:TrkA family potassium uptake protein n=1 Tax=Thioclava litoralis TaxID=3076557 RepID=A0ABZ1E419_9RHOB|nr:TrkA family potassium uptake protein [Thioclava sp. FTW29]
MPKQNRTFAVIGLGAFGSAVASELARFGNTVMGIDQDESRVAKLAEALTSTIILDATDEQALREAGVDRYDVALVAIGHDIESSILATMNVRVLGVDQLWVKAINKTHHRILSKLGADRIILPEQEMGKHVAQRLNNPVVQDYVNLGNGFSVVTMAVPERLKGRTLASLEIGSRHDVRMLGLMRGTEFLPCTTPELELAAQDKLLVLGRRPELRAFGDAL